jgi:hypothetical protein
MLADDELLFVDDEADANELSEADDESRPTPVIPAGNRVSTLPSSPAIPPLPPPPRASTPGMPSVPPPLPPGARVPGQIPVPVVNMKADVTEGIDLRDAEIVDFVQDKPAPVRRTMAPIRPETMFPMMMRRSVEQAPKVTELPPAEPAQRSPSIPPNPEAGKKRAAALAAQVKQRTSNTMVPQPNRPLDLELDLGQGASARDVSVPKASRALDLDFDHDPKPKDKPPTKVERSLDLDLGEGTRTREEPPVKVERDVPKPVVIRMGNEGSTGQTERTEVRVVATPAPEVKEAPPVESTRSPLGGDERGTGARVAAAARERAASAREASADAGGLSEKRMRQIYGEYVDAKRAVKESTAGVTFDTLAKQLKQQAEKLEASHPGRKVDYSVVMKNGKPTLKPILR